MQFRFGFPIEDIFYKLVIWLQIYFSRLSAPIVRFQVNWKLFNNLFVLLPLYRDFYRSMGIKHFIVQLINFSTTKCVQERCTTPSMKLKFEPRHWLDYEICVSFTDQKSNFDDVIKNEKWRHQSCSIKSF